MVKISKINDNKYEIMEELTATSLWFSDLDKELCKKKILLAEIEYTNEEEKMRVEFNKEVNVFLKKANKMSLIDKLNITVEDIILLKFLYGTSAENIFKKLQAGLKSW